MSDELVAALARMQQLPTHVRNPHRAGIVHPIAPSELEMLAHVLAAGGFDSPMPVIDALPPAPDLPTTRRRPDGALEIHLDPRAGRDI